MNEHSLWEKENVRLILVLCIGLVLLIGCGEPNLDDPKVRKKILAKAIDENDLQTRWTPLGEEMRYTPNQQVGHTGWVKGDRSVLHDRSVWRHRSLWQLKHGRKHGIYIRWYSNQQNAEKGVYKDSSKDGLWTE